MRIFTWDTRFEELATCIYEAWEWGLQNGHENLKIMREPVTQYDLFAEYIHVDLQEEKAAKVLRSIRQKISFSVYETIYLASLYNEDVSDDIYRFLHLAFRFGAQTEHMLNQPLVMKMMKIKKRVLGEKHSFSEFLRFDALPNDTFIAHIEPKSNIVALLAEAFSDRMPSLHWIIVDDGRKLALVHRADEKAFLYRLSAAECAKLQESERIQDAYKDLWRCFFHSISIKERENKTRQASFFPLYKRKHAPEFTFPLSKDYDIV